jgi:hypothetical protein
MTTFANLCSAQLIVGRIRRGGASRQKKFQGQKLFDFRCLLAHRESIRRSRLTFFSVTTNCATVSLNKGAF